MKQCKQCGESKPGKEFPCDSNFTCLICHCANAARWNELPWADGKPATPRRKRIPTAQQKEAMREGRHKFKTAMAFSKSLIRADDEEFYV